MCTSRFVSHSVYVWLRGGVWLRVEVDGVGMVYRGEMM